MSELPSSGIPDPGFYRSSMSKQAILPMYIVPEDHYVKCDIHGELCTHAYFEDDDIAEMLATDGWIDCPLCLEDICDQH